jgi:hypothetical protein
MLGSSKQNGLGRRNSSEPGTPGIPGSPGGFSNPNLAYVASDYVQIDYVEDTE